ncbi:MAG: hypothetical protein Q7S47_01080, partial [bacterium]|nr:hypothetical protein [bacterium]
EIIARSAKVPAILLSPSPTLDAIHRHARSILQTPSPTRRAFILEDIHDQFGNREFSCIGSALTRRLEQMHEGQSAILFLNRNGFGSSVMCMDCQRVVQCPHCALPLTHHKDEGINTLRCHHCLHIEPIRLICPYCASVNVKSVGKGIERVEAEARIAFPQLSIQCLTYPSLNGLLWKNKAPDMIGVIDALSPLHIPDFRALEHIWQFLDKITTYTTRHKIPLVIQTFAPDHPIFAALSSAKPSLFYTTELADRMNMGYPPFTRLVKVITRHTENKVAHAEAERLHALLHAANPSAPYAAHPQKQNGKYVWNLLLRLPTKRSLAELLTALPRDTVIDIDPESTL